MIAWHRACARWRLAAEQTGGRFLWARNGRISLLWGRKIRIVRV